MRVKEVLENLQRELNSPKEYKTCRDESWPSFKSSGRELKESETSIEKSCRVLCCGGFTWGIKRENVCFLVGKGSGTFQWLPLGFISLVSGLVGLAILLAQTRFLVIMATNYSGFSNSYWNTTLKTAFLWSGWMEELLETILWFYHFLLCICDVFPTKPVLISLFNKNRTFAAADTKVPVNTSFVCLCPR